VEVACSQQQIPKQFFTGQIIFYHEMRVLSRCRWLNWPACFRQRQNSEPSNSFIPSWSQFWGQKGMACHLSRCAVALRLPGLPEASAPVGRLSLLGWEPLVEEMIWTC